MYLTKYIYKKKKKEQGQRKLSIFEYLYSPQQAEDSDYATCFSGANSPTKL